MGTKPRYTFLIGSHQAPLRPTETRFSTSDGGSRSSGPGASGAVGPTRPLFRDARDPGTDRRRPPSRRHTLLPSPRVPDRSAGRGAAVTPCRTAPSIAFRAPSPRTAPRRPAPPAPRTRRADQRRARLSPLSHAPRGRVLPAYTQPRRRSARLNEGRAPRTPEGPHQGQEAQEVPRAEAPGRSRLQGEAPLAPAGRGGEGQAGPLQAHGPALPVRKRACRSRTRSPQTRTRGSEGAQTLVG